MFRQASIIIIHYKAVLSVKCQSFDRKVGSAEAVPVGRDQGYPITDTASFNRLCNRPTSRQSWDHQPCVLPLRKHSRKGKKHWAEREGWKRKEWEAAEGTPMSEEEEKVLQALEPRFFCSLQRTYARADGCSWRNYHPWRACAGAQEKGEWEGDTTMYCITLSPCTTQGGELDLGLK